MSFPCATSRGLILAWLLAPFGFAADGRPVAPTLSVVTPVSVAFRQQTEVATRTIPDHVWQAVEQAGWQIRLAEFVVDVEPEIRNDRPRGWPADMTWQNTDAVHLPQERVLVLAEKRRNRLGQVVTTTRVAGVMRHELGHAFDMANGGTLRFRSSFADFRAAYSADVQQMAAEQKVTLGYYLQASDAGRQEAFAESFGIIFGGGSDAAHRAAFESAFPRTIDFVRKHVGE